MTFNRQYILEEEEVKGPSLEDRFNEVGRNKTHVESSPEWALRNAGQHTARAAETVAGLPGNLKQTARKSVDDFSEFLGMPKLSETEKKVSLGKNSPVDEFILNPPTSQEIREKGTPYVAEKLGLDKNYFEPRNEAEKAAGELNQDIVGFFLPGNRMNLLTKIGAPILGNLGYHGLKYLGVDEQNAQKAKAGLMLATSVAGNSNPQEFAHNRINQARQMIPQNMTVDATPLGNSLTPLADRLNRGLNVPSKSQARQGINDLAHQSQNGRISMESLMDARDNVNEWIAEAHGFDVPAPVRDRTVANLNELKGAIIETIDNNLMQRFPQAGELYRSGYEAAAVTHQSNAISNFIQKHFGQKAASIGAKVLFPTIAGGAAFLPKTALVGAGAYPFYKTGQVLYRVSHSPTLSQYYQDVIRESLRGNAPAMVKAMKKFDEAMLEDEKKQQKGKKLSKSEFKEQFMNKG